MNSVTSLLEKVGPLQSSLRDKRDLAKVLFSSLILLRRRIAFNLLVVLIYRFGNFIPISGIDRSRLPNSSPRKYQPALSQQQTQPHAIICNIMRLPCIWPYIRKID